MAKRGIDRQKENHGKRITSPNDPENYDAMPLIFSLERIQDGEFSFSELDQEGKAQFADAVFKRRSLTWSALKKTGRLGLGFEKIDITSIKTGMPKFITEDNKDLLAFRFSGKKPMVGYRYKNIFYVLWFDHKRKLYKHGP